MLTYFLFFSYKFYSLTKSFNFGNLKKEGGEKNG